MSRSVPRVGRKSKLTPELIGKLRDVLTGGSTVADACAYVGISEQSFYLWIKLGEALQNGDEHPDLPVVPKKTRKMSNADFDALMREYETHIQLLTEFPELVKKAQAFMRVNAIARIIAASTNGEWQASAWLLERSDPKNWGRRVVENTHDGEITIKVVREKKQINREDTDDDAD